jgi:hypothetical protein
MQPTDRVTEALVEALSRALALPGEHRLYRAGKLDGLFPARTGAASEAALRGLGAGLLERSRVEIKGKTEIDWVRITPRGVEFLHQHESPVQALHELQHTLRANQNAIPVWLDEMRGVLRQIETRLGEDAGRWLSRLQALENRVGETLRRLEAASPLVPAEVAAAHPWAIDALNYLDRRRGAGAPDACALPELFTAVVAHHRGLSIAAFHEGLRVLHRRRALLLRPAARDEDMTHPEYALLDESCCYYTAVR